MSYPLRDWALGLALAVQAGLAAPMDFQNAQSFLQTWCAACHQGGSPQGGFRIDPLKTAESLRAEAQRWQKAALRTRNREMPPKGAPAPTLDQAEQFASWSETAVRGAICSGGPVPGPFPLRRLNRDEYAATVRDLLDIHLDIADMLPADGAGGEGFDNAAETLFLSPLHSEKYLETARFVLDYAAKEFKSRSNLLTAAPGNGVSARQAARRILENFLPKAFRRPVSEQDIQSYLGLFEAAQRRGRPFESSILFSLRGALVSPMFLFRAEPPNRGAQARPAGPFAFASRISYFLWGSMPDEFLFDVAASGRLHDPEVLKQVIPRMLRNDRSLGFAQRFVEQWLGTRALGGEKAPDAKLFPLYASDEELRSDVRLQPVLFFRELLIRNLSLLNLLDSKHTIGTSNLSKLYQSKLPVASNNAKQPQWVELPPGIHRGGLLGMPAVLAVSSYPYRTSPVLRGVWILDSILGTPPPPPPPDVPQLEEHKQGAAPKTMRERLAQHRRDPVCASCHSRIDGPGFALENFDVIGRWRDQESGRPIDNSGELAGGTRFAGPDQLKTVLLERKDLFLRNLSSKMLGFALGRGLTLEDSCAVDAILAQLKENDYKARTLVEAIVTSAPFRYQKAGPPAPDKEVARQ